MHVHYVFYTENSNSSNIVIGVVIGIVAALAIVIIILVVIIVRVVQKGRNKSIRKGTFNAADLEVPIEER